jgi:hypothetical protein
MALVGPGERDGGERQRQHGEPLTRSQGHALGVLEEEEEEERRHQRDRRVLDLGDE